jgi:hypothetical protein
MYKRWLSYVDNITVFGSWTMSIQNMKILPYRIDTTQWRIFESGTNDIYYCSNLHLGFVYSLDIINYIAAFYFYIWFRLCLINFVLDKIIGVPPLYPKTHNKTVPYGLSSEIIIFFFCHFFFRCLNSHFPNLTVRVLKIIL